MASQTRTARHVSARNAILIWLAGVILFAGVGIVLAYHALRDSSIYAQNMTPLMSQKDATQPAPTLRAVKVRPATDASADIAQQHSSAVASATETDALATTGAEAPAPIAAQPAGNVPTAAEPLTPTAPIPGN